MEKFKEELLEERTELLNRTLNLDSFMKDGSSKLSYDEWDLLRQQFYTMQEYLRVLTRRCQYYNLIPECNLNLY